MPSLKTLNLVAKQAALRGGKVLLKYFRSSRLTHERKKDLTWVTNTDQASEKSVFDFLHQKTPKFSFLAEESAPAARRRPGYQWIVDPLDGTHNFMRGIPIFAVSIALQKDGRIIVGAIYLPYENILINAIKGQGTFVNGTRQQIKKRKLRDSVLVLETYFDQTDMNMLQKFVSQTTELRIYNSASSMLAYLALGRVDAVIDRVDKPWDWAAGSLIVTEAGGVVSNFQGQKLDLYTPSYVAANPGCHQTIIDILKKTKR